MSFFQGFKEFAIRGTVVDMGIGLIIGAAFGSIVTSFVSDILMPPLGLVLGKVDFSNLYINLSGGHYSTLSEAEAAGAVTVNYGTFLETVIHFIIVAFASYVVIIQMVKLRKASIESTKSKNCPFCYSDIPSRALRCPKCTSTLEKKDTPPDRKNTLVRIRSSK
ncbi:large conductance mechanosensitive channel protein MscL [Salipaludibacillus sp. CUR1]|uniref:Large-conductance mechanosensitive channel n=1 Tax=Salipaludibacillus aurantiacus TaxID=1601833 RepID=A0A1H9XAM3_9BACI|nr:MULTISPECIES: large conductance mechanosensitive channel protein MscL [Salipaludibacillus]MCE7792800.1 large conductance mechanosensitive channel protein MscL [Salipaludibacillus sp. CUR1]SES43182.1 large conductance mechanosensitive channel [Salipaludibacillus aurantiacus]